MRDNLNIKFFIFLIFISFTFMIIISAVSASDNLNSVLYDSNLNDEYGSNLNDEYGSNLNDEYGSNLNDEYGSNLNDEYYIINKSIPLNNGIENNVVNDNFKEIYVSVDGDDIGGDGTVYNPYKTIKYSVSKAQNGTRIYLNPGEYSGENNTNIIIDKDLNIIANPILSGDVILNGNNNSRLFDVYSSEFVLDGLTLINGHNIGGETDLFPGGAISSSANLVILNCVFKYCDGYTKGGAIYSKGPLTILNSLFVNNSASKSGGAICVLDYLKVENSLFEDNFINSTSFSEAGGAISSAKGGYIINSIFNHNSAGASGAVSSSGSMIIDNCSFINNIGNYCVGAITNNGKLIINNSYMGYNYASFYAGVLLATRVATSTEIYNTIMEYNHVGMFASSINCYTTGLVIQQCVFRNNYVDGNINKGEINTDYDVNALYNWWGKNKIGDYVAEESQFVNGSRYLIMSFNSTELATGQIAYLTVDLKHYFDNDTKLVNEYVSDINLPLKVTFYTNKGEILNTTLVNGTVTIKYTPCEGINKVYAKIDNQILSLDVNTRNYTLISAPTKTLSSKTSSYYAITLKDVNGKLLSNKLVKIRIKNKVYNVKTDSKGQAKIKVIFSNIGTYEVITTFDGDNQYVNKTVKSKIIVKMKTIIIAPLIKVKSKKSKYFTITLKDSNKKALKGKKVKILINGKIYKCVTNSKGHGKIKVKLYKKKTYKVKVKFIEDGFYFGSSKLTYIKVV